MITAQKTLKVIIGALFATVASSNEICCEDNVVWMDSQKYSCDMYKTQEFCGGKWGILYFWKYIWNSLSKFWFNLFQ